MRETEGEAAGAIIGNEAAWRAALGPTASRDALQLAGDADLGREVLEQVALGGPVQERATS